MPVSPIQVSRNVESTAPGCGMGHRMRYGMMRRAIGLALVCILACIFCGAAFAQAAAMSAPDPSPELVGEQRPAEDAAAVLPEAPDVSKASAAPTLPLQPGDVGFTPLRNGERASLFFNGYLASPVSYLAMTASATVGWIADQPQGWGRTVRGYGQRTGTEVVLYTAEEAIHDAGDAALGLDPRYFPCRCSGLWRRSGHALKMTFLAYDGAGKLYFDLPRFVGDYGTSMLVTTWYPAGYSPLAQGVKMGHLEVGLDAGTNLLREFNPEIKRVMRALKLAKPATS